MLPDEALLILTVKINSCHPGPQIDKCCQHIGQGNHKDSAKPNIKLIVELSAKNCPWFYTYYICIEHHSFLSEKLQFFMPCIPQGVTNIPLRIWSILT